MRVRDAMVTLRTISVDVYRTCAVLYNNRYACVAIQTVSFTFECLASTRGKNQFHPISKNSQHSKTRGTRHGAVVSTVEARGMSTPGVSEIVPAGTSDGGDVAPKPKGKPPKGPGGGRGGRGRGRGRGGALGKEKARDLTSPLRMITKRSTQIH